MEDRRFYVFILEYNKKEKSELWRQHGIASTLKEAEDFKRALLEMRKNTAFAIFEQM